VKLTTHLQMCRGQECVELYLRYVFMAWCLVEHRDNFTLTLCMIILKLSGDEYKLLCSLS